MDSHFFLVFVMNEWLKCAFSSRTGKQLVSAVLNQLTVGRKPLNLISKEQIPDEMWGKGSMESIVIIKENELLCGVLGKKQFGSSSQLMNQLRDAKEK
jgi:hypothetical protein